MGAKHSKKNAKKEAAAPTAPVPAMTAAAATGPSLASAGVAPAWIDSTEPRKRTLGKIVLVAVWIYVAALWLLALDQTFHWGIFGPKVPPIP